MKFDFTTQGVCARLIQFDLAEDGMVHDVVYTGGCNGNLKAIGKLVEGMPYDKVIDVLKGNTCGMKGTSCADQLAKALELAAEKMNLKKSLNKQK